MRKIIKILLPGLLAMMLFNGCENMISDVDVPESQKKMVVFSVISPQYESIKVKVTYSRPLFNQPPTQQGEGFNAPVHGAMVRISDGTKTVIIPYDAESEKYILSAENYPIQPGKTYLLEVEAPNGDKVTSSCTVPDQTPPNLELVSLIKDSSNMYMGERAYIANLRFKDIPGSAQFYDVMVMGEYYDTLYNITNIYQVYFTRNERLSTDNNKDGEWFNYTTSPTYFPANCIGRLVASVSITDESYYTYHKSLWSFEGENPFQEPEPVFTNINGGLGVFAALIIQNFEFELPEN